MSEELTVKSDLPTLQDLVTDVDTYKKEDELNFLLNQPVPKKWISKHPIIKKEIIDDTGRKQRVPYEYLAIDKVEYLLRKIFKRYRIEITGQGQSFNGVYVTVRVHYWNLVRNDWDFHDGIGAIQLQTKSGSSPADLQNINNGALSMAFPHAKTLAVKDACDCFGKIFGADLNRRDTLSVSLDKPKPKDKEYERITNHINKSKSIKELQQVEQHLKDKLHKDFYDVKYNELQNKE